MSITIENRHIGAEADGHLDRVTAHHSSADDGDLGGGDTWYAAEEDAGTAARRLEAMGPGLDGHAPGDMGHRGKER